MSEQYGPISARTCSPHVVYTLPGSDKTVTTEPYKYQVTHTPKRNMYLQLFLKHLKNEYWAYIALAGLTCLYTGIMVAVFGFSKLLESHSAGIEWFGLILILMGIGLVLASMILYHRKVQKLRPCICCGRDEEVFEPPPRSKKRLRFAPNLISPYYEEARQREKTMMLEASPVVVDSRFDNRFDTRSERMRSRSGMDTRSVVVTTPVQVLNETDMVETEEQRAYGSEGSSTALITSESNGNKVTHC